MVYTWTGGNWTVVSWYFNSTSTSVDTVEGTSTAYCMYMYIVICLPVFWPHLVGVSELLHSYRPCGYSSRCVVGGLSTQCGPHAAHNG